MLYMKWKLRTFEHPHQHFSNFEGQGDVIWWLVCDETSWFPHNFSFCMPFIECFQQLSNHASAYQFFSTFYFQYVLSFLIIKILLPIISYHLFSIVFFFSFVLLNCFWLGLIYHTFIEAHMRTWMDELQLHNFTALFEKKLLSHKRHTETQRFVPLVKIKVWFITVLL